MTLPGSTIRAGVCVLLRLCLVGILLALPGVALAQTPLPAPVSASHAPPEGTGRPRIGLALGGGAARGLAHLGVLEWLEEHRIPVDSIVGTSIGGLLGAGYAIGMSPADLRELMRTTDWDVMFLVDSPFKYKTFRRKQEARAYPGQIDLGLKGGLTFPSALNPGQQAQLLFDRFTAPYFDAKSFDEFPTRFRCVATDLRRAELVVLGEGSLSLALRATMAVPGLLTPVEWDGRLLVDGGTLNNVPADVARLLGADVVIAVNVGSSNYRSPQRRSLFQVLAGAVDAMMVSGVRAALRSAEVVITPELKGFTGLEFRESDRIADLGYRAAEAMKAQLLPYAVDDAAYEAWRRERDTRRRTSVPGIDFVEVAGFPDRSRAQVERRFARHATGRALDRAAIERDILELAGTDRFEVIHYVPVRAEDGRVGVRVEATTKTWGPPFLLPAIDLQNIDTGSVAFNLRGRLVLDDVPIRGAELRSDVTLGSRQSAGVEVERRIAGSRVFVIPRAYWAREDINDFDARRLVGESRRTTVGAGIDVGLDLGPRNEVRLGYDVADIRATRRVGDPSQPEIDGRSSFATLQWTFDGQSSPVVPTRGIHSRAWLSYHFDAPDFRFEDRRVAGGAPLTQAEGRLSYFRRVRHRHRVFVMASAGTSFGEDAGVNKFSLGGVLRLSALRSGALRGDHYVVGGGGVLREVFRLPDILGGSAFLGGWFESGAAFDRWERARIENHLSAGFVVETILGPLFVGGSVALGEGDTRFHVNLGPLLR